MWQYKGFVGDIYWIQLENRVGVWKEDHEHRADDDKGEEQRDISANSVLFEVSSEEVKGGLTAVGFELGPTSSITIGWSA